MCEAVPAPNWRECPARKAFLERKEKSQEVARLKTKDASARLAGVREGCLSLLRSVCVVIKLRLVDELEVGIVEGLSGECQSLFCISFFDFYRDVGQFADQFRDITEQFDNASADIALTMDLHGI